MTSSAELDAGTTQHGGMHARKRNNASNWQVLYAVKGAVEKAGEGNAAPLFAEELKKIEFTNDQQKKEAMNAAFVSVCSTGVKKEVDLMLAQVCCLNLS